MKVVFYGAGELTKTFLKEGTDDYEIVAILDKKYESIKTICGHKVYSPECISNFDYEYIIIALDDLKKGMDEVIKEVYCYLIELGVPEDKIILQSFKSLEHHINRFPRKDYLFSLSKLMHKEGVRGDVA